MKYLVQLQVKKASGKVHLLSSTVHAGTPQKALEIMRDMSASAGEIVGGFVTSDPHKIKKEGQ